MVPSVDSLVKPPALQHQRHSGNDREWSVVSSYVSLNLFGGLGNWLGVRVCKHALSRISDRVSLRCVCSTRSVDSGTKNVIHKISYLINEGCQWTVRQHQWPNLCQTQGLVCPKHGNRLQCKGSDPVLYKSSPNESTDSSVISHEMPVLGGGITKPAFSAFSGSTYCPQPWTVI